jgi:large repetitive protein
MLLLLSTKPLHPGSCAGNYTITRTWTATDDCNNTISHTQIITVEDTTAPVWAQAMPANVTVQCNAIPTVPAVITATDNCDNDVTIAFNETTTPGSCAGNYTITRTWTATDDCNNTISHTQIITVEDTTAPVWAQAMPANVTVQCNAIPAVPAVITATDNCDTDVTIAFNETTTPGSCAGNYTITRTWTATDDCNNTISHTQIITVEDTTAPVWAQAMPTNVTVQCNAIPTVPAGIAATDNCDADVTVAFNETTTPGSCVGNYTITRTWTATDDCNNTISHTQIITVEDTTAPVWAQAMPTNVTVQCNAIPAVPAVITATDNCDNDVTIAFNETTTPGSCAGNYTITRTWTATDDCNNTISHTQIITVEDTTAPVWAQAMPTNVTVQCNAIPAVPAGITATDNCDNDVTVAFNETTTPGSCAGNYTITRTWTATDDCNNTISHTQIITVEDTTAPVWAQAMPTNVTVQCNAIPTVPAGITATDNCDNDVTVAFNETTTPGSCAGNYTITRTWTATDDCNNTVSHTQIITVEDTTAPVWAQAMPANVTVQCNAIPAVPAVITATDNCDTDVTIAFNETTTPGSCAGNYTITRTWTATDDCNNTISHTQIVTVEDTTAPVWAQAMPANVTVQCNAIPTVPAGIAATDNCDADVTVAFNETTTPGSCVGNYTITRTWTATDDCNNTISHTQIITVEDTTAPVWAQAMPANVTVQCNAIPAVPAVITATDNCDNDVTIAFNETTTPGSCAGNYTITRTWTATDDCNNTISHTQIITVEDTTAPVWAQAMPANVTVQCNAIPTVPAGITATDNCDNDVTVAFNETTTPGSCAGNYTITRTWTATDDCNNTISHTQIITVEDTTAPLFTTAPANLTLECDGSGNTAAINAWLNSAVATDACGLVTITHNYTGLSDLCGTTGTATVTWTATDACGNTATISATVTVQDTTAAVITCIPNLVVVADEGESFAELTIATPLVTDACGTITLVNDFNNINNASGQYPLGVTTVTWTATDACGNTSTCSFTVTVQDDEAPVIICPAPIQVNCQEAAPAPFANYAEFEAAGGSAYDNNEIIESSFTLLSESTAGPACNRIISRVYQISDDDGNTSTCTHQIIVKDEQAPVFTVVPENIEVECDGNGNTAQLDEWLALVAATDNCSDVIITHDFNGLTEGCGATGAATVTWTATDACGNTATTSATLTVQDTTIPAFTTAPANLTLECDGSGNTTTISDWLNSAMATDNCGSVTITHNYTGLSDLCGTTGTATVTWTATDACGNTATISATVTVQDTAAPVITCIPNLVVVADEGESFAELTIATPLATDACGIITLVNDFNNTNNASGQYPLGVTTVTWTATDACGNTSTCSFTVKVQDDEAPAIISPSTIFVNCQDELPAPFESFDQFVAAGGSAYDNNEIIEESFALISENTEGSACNLIISRIYQISDNDDNTSTCTHQIVIKDELSPIFTITPTDLTVECDGNGNIAQIEEWLTLVAATDNCSEVVINHDFNSLTEGCGTTGTATVTWTAIDACGNSATTSAIFTISDTTAPVILCSDNLRIAYTPVSLGEYTTMGDEFDISIQEDNSVLTHNLDHANNSSLAGYVFTAGDTEVVWTATDACGNERQCTITVRVQTYGIELTKTASTSTYSYVGQTIEYVITIINTGEIALTDILVSDPLTGLNTLLDNLDAGQSIEFKETYSITMTNIENGQLLNIATAETLEGNNIQIGSSAEVTIYYEAAVDTLNISVTTHNVACHGGNSGVADLTITGGVAPYTINWITEPAQNGLQATDLLAGTYKVIVIDSMGSEAEKTFTIHQPTSSLNITNQVGDLICFGDESGSINVQVSGGTAPYTFNWAHGVSTSDIYNLSAGTYNLTIKDANGCIITGEFNIQEPEPISIANIIIPEDIQLEDYKNLISFETYGGIPPYEYTWDSQVDISALSENKQSSVQLIIVDSHGCDFSHNFLLPDIGEDPVELEGISIPQAFSPNGDGQNDVWVIDGLEKLPSHTLQVFNRYGTMVYQASPYNNDWSGTPNRGSFYSSDGNLPAGTYYYILTPEPGKKPKAGWVYLAR